MQETRQGVGNGGVRLGWTQREVLVRLNRASAMQKARVVLVVR